MSTTTASACTGSSMLRRLGAPRTLACLACLLTLLPARGRAQEADAPQGEVPGLSSVLAEDARAVRSGIAGIGFVEGQDLRLSVERASSGTARSDQLSLGWAGRFGIVAQSLHFERMWRSTGAPFSRTTYGVALSGHTLSFGLALRWYHSPDPDLRGAVTFDTGLAWRPLPFLGAYAGLADAGHAAREGTFILGLGLRLADGRLSLGVDRRFAPAALPWDAAGEVVVAARLRVIDGLGVAATLHQDLTGGPPSVRAALTLDLAHAGLTGGSGAQGLSEDYYAELRLSTARHRALAGAPEPVRIDLAAALEPEPWSLLGGSQADPVVRLIQQLDRIRRDPEVSGILLTVAGSEALSMATAEMLRASLQALERAGKEVEVHLEGADDALYYMVSSADRITASPAAILQINGLVATYTYLGEGLSDLGVHPEFVRIGEYKHAPDTFTRSEMSETQRQVGEALLDDVWARWREAVMHDRHLDAGALDAALAHGVLTPEVARAAGLIDEVVPREALEGPSRASGARRYVRGYASRRYAGRSWGPRPAVAVVPVKGTILPGHSPKGPASLLGEVAGAESVAEAIGRAARSPEVAAIVLYIDSPGGDAAASDLIWQAVRHANEQKPVVACMANVAASGGYYVASGAREIVAEPSTITGSIGIFAGHADLSGLYANLGVRVQTLLRGPLPDLFGTEHRWSDAERKALEAWVENGYALFLRRVATGRGITREAVDAVGRGRVWTGAQAHDRGLVDHLGGLPVAVERAKALAGLAAEETVELLWIEETPHPLAALGGSRPPQIAAPPPIEQGVRRLAADLALLASRRPLARLPFDLQIR